MSEHALASAYNSSLSYSNRTNSNGLMWNDVAAKALDLELINLAAGGATTNNTFITGGTGADSTIPVPSASDQVASFLSWDAPRRDDVFVHWIGANDILFNTSITAAQVVELIKQDVNRLYHAGRYSPSELCIVLIFDKVQGILYWPIITT